MPATLLCLVAVAALASSLVFVRFVYVLTLGYGGAMVAMGTYMWLASRASGLPPSPLVDAHLALLILYGARYFGLMAWRERYYPEFTAQHAETELFSAARRVKTLALVSLLYAGEASPALFHLQARAHGFPRAAACALLVAALGLLLETVADCQKARFKLRLTRAQRESPAASLFTGGLFSRCRRPNYAGAVMRLRNVWSARASHSFLPFPPTLQRITAPVY